MSYVQKKRVRGATSEYNKLNRFHLNIHRVWSWTRGPSKYNHRYGLHLVVDEYGRAHRRAERRLWVTQRLAVRESYHFAEMHHSFFSHTVLSICATLRPRVNNWIVAVIFSTPSLQCSILSY